MSKRIIVLCLGLVFLVSSYAFAEEKIGYVNTIKVIQEYNKAKKYNDLLEKKEEEINKEVETKRQEAAEKIEKMRSKFSLLDEEKKKEEQEKMIQEERKYQGFLYEKRADLMKQQDEYRREVSEDIMNEIEDYAKKNKYSFILERAALLYAIDENNVTDKIINELNKKKR